MHPWNAETISHRILSKTTPHSPIFEAFGSVTIGVAGETYFFCLLILGLGVGNTAGLRRSTPIRKFVGGRAAIGLQDI